MTKSALHFPLAPLPKTLVKKLNRWPELGACLGRRGCDTPLAEEGDEPFGDRRAEDRLAGDGAISGWATALTWCELFVKTG
jgi:hypothetical protein